MILITGGAGFIGSNLIASLNDRGIDDIDVYDSMAAPDQWRNLAKRKIRRLFVTPTAFDKEAPYEAVVHLLANTDTQDSNAGQVMYDNYELSMNLLQWAQERNIPFIYASSAATYGHGSNGFSDDPANLDKLRPLSLYAWSKHLFDQHVAKQLPPSKSAFAMVVDECEGKTAVPTAQVVGLKFFNVYGPNEYHKGKMASLLAQQFDRVRVGTGFSLFGPTSRERSALPPMRDFVYVEDAVNVIIWMLGRPEVSGIFNVGTGQARTFEALGRVVFGWQEGDEQINYIEHPPSSQKNYQFYTWADLTNLRKAGCDVSFRLIEEGVKLYVEKYLSQKDRYR